MKVLIAYASRYGATAGVARELGQVLSNCGHETAVSRLDEVESIIDYDAVVLGSAVYVGRWLKPAREFASRHRKTLAARPVWLFSSGPIGDPPLPAEESPDAAAIAGEISARDHRVFRGSLDRERLNLAERVVTQIMGAPQGYYRDWTAIIEYAMGIHDELERMERDRGGAATPAQLSGEDDQ